MAHSTSKLHAAVPDTLQPLSTSDSHPAMAGPPDAAQWRRLYEAVLALANTPDHGYVLDRNHRFTYANDALLAMWGRTWDEAIGKNCLELGYEPWQAAMHDREMDQAIGERRLVRGEVPFTGTNGRRIYDYTFFPIMDANGEVVAVGGYSRDITDRKRMEILLGEQQSVLEMIIAGRSTLECLEAITSSVSRLSPNARAAVLIADEQRACIAEIVSAGIPLSFACGIQGAPINDLPVGTCGAAIFEGRPVLCSDIAKEEKWSSEWRELCLAHGIASAYSTPVFLPGKHAVGSLFLCFDQPHEPNPWEQRIGEFGGHLAGIVLERKMIEERQKNAEDALRKAEKFAAAGRMAATIAHEINNPLEAMVNLTFLLRQEDLSTEGQEHLDSLWDELSRVCHITKQTLEFYREGRAAAAVNLAEPIQAAAELFARKAKLQGTRIEILHKTPATIYGFAGELRQVFANLIGNSLEAGSAVIRIRVSRACHENRNGVRIVFADNGSGIPMDSRRKLFEPFFTTKEEKGTGLGLWVSKGIVQKHEGWIRMRTSTRPGRTGTSFCLFLPAVQNNPVESYKDFA
jgi:PAS domain S-box-containing protein